MTVKELMNQLKWFHDDLEVMFVTLNDHFEPGDHKLEVQELAWPKDDDIFPEVTGTKKFVCILSNE